MSRQRVTVVDSKNHERVLGTIPAPTDVPLGRSYNMALYRNLAFARLSDYAVPDITYVRFDIVVTHGVQRTGWQVITQYGLATDAKLEDLAYLDDFRFPGESDRSAYMRRRNCA